MSKYRLSIAKCTCIYNHPCVKINTCAYLNAQHRSPDRHSRLKGVSPWRLAKFGRTMSNPNRPVACDLIYICIFARFAAYWDKRLLETWNPNHMPNQNWAFPEIKWTQIKQIEVKYKMKQLTAKQTPPKNQQTGPRRRRNHTMMALIPGAMVIFLVVVLPFCQFMVQPHGMSCHVLIHVFHFLGLEVSSFFLWKLLENETPCCLYVRTPWRVPRDTIIGWKNVPNTKKKNAGRRKGKTTPKRPGKRLLNQNLNADVTIPIQFHAQILKTICEFWGL